MVEFEALNSVARDLMMQCILSYVGYGECLNFLRP